MKRYDVIVAGLGAMGSATAAQCAMRGANVLGLERWTPGHAHGSSHGDSRIIREMYFEHPMYVPLVQRAYTLWEELEQKTDTELLHVTGGLMAGPATSEIVTGTIRSAREHGLPYEQLDAKGIHQRFPAFQVLDHIVGVVDPRAGHLNPDAGNAAHHALARAHGAELHFDEGVTAWEPDGEGVKVTTARGTYYADQLCLSVGAYLAPLVASLKLPLTVERQVLGWFEPDPGHAKWKAPDCPIWAYDNSAGQMTYGFPRLARGVKMAVMHEGERFTDGGAIRETPDSTDLAFIRERCGELLPAIRTAELREMAVCRFTNTPDLDFVIDHHPEFPQVLVSSPCSGHGYKFASAIGEVSAELLLDGATAFDISPFGIGRLAGKRA